MAGWSGASVTAVHIVDVLLIDDIRAARKVPVEQVREPLLERARGELKRRVDDLPQPPGSKRADVRLEVVAGSPTHDVIRIAEQASADLLVIGRNSSSDPARGPGGVAMACAMHAPCSVLVVPIGCEAPFRTIIVGVDFSESSKRAVEQALDVARAEGVTLHAVHTFFGPWNVHHYRAPTPEVSPAFQAQHRQELEQRLREMVEPLAANAGGVRVECRLISDYSSPGFALDREVRQRRADLLVVGTHGRRGVTRLLLGSTAERALRETEAAVLLVRAAG
jgi:nucleotide-binding universal stress UspA family protein